ncbi:sensor histidine kinase [Mangrovibacterium diazotrophicum]|uniref:Histidine kinase/DNA gyrase B/HSP90-like ATPase n=1 Tax=Mangrovibacterium diazotrophicum TaxID=1261403 RepID=A0A419VWI6_9BACT|nr:HAMP domain-containing sensor histidine kinase [Mangrovibacterium diazotrophicum]RKD86514.1 histidine kinase/DNA gyrase B/HSP90-like ATPase [Mangrovibacterium diazotrophicum]
MEVGDNNGTDRLERLIGEEITIGSIQLVKELLSSTSSIVCILNSQNQIVFANDTLIQKYNLDLERDIFGLRFGEIMGCVNLKGGESVCGTTEKCRYCGANYAFKDFWSSRQSVVNECRLIREEEGYTRQYDLEIKATPFHFEGDYMVLSLVDITEQKRREILERIFFHDIINMAGSLRGILNIMKEVKDEQDEVENFFEIAASLSDEIIDEIKAQQQLLKAESGELEVSTEKVNMDGFLLEICNKVKYCQEAFDRKIDPQDFTSDVEFTTDKVLLTRVIFNMAKNALEAIPRGESIRIEAYLKNDKIRIEVHNDTWIEEDVRNQLFQRSYSTKGKNRGVGTYSMKLLGERYLKGVVNFESTEANGTTFYIEIPEAI